MSELETETPEEYVDPGDKRVSMRRSNIDALESRAKRADAAERELAFLKAGINPDDERLKYFFKGYEGDIDAAQIKAAAIAAGFIADPNAQATDQVKASGEAQERIGNAATGQTPPNVQGDRAAEYAEALATGGLNGIAAVAAKYGQVVGQNV
jgi:hypothetical protein